MRSTILIFASGFFIFMVIAPAEALKCYECYNCPNVSASTPVKTCNPLGTWYCSQEKHETNQGIDIAVIRHLIFGLHTDLTVILQRGCVDKPCPTSNRMCKTCNDKDLCNKGTIQW